MRLRIFVAIAIALATSAQASEPAKATPCRDWGFQEPDQDPTEEVLDVVHRLVKRTNTAVGECAPSTSTMDPRMRVCGVTEMPPDKFRSRVETVFELLGPTVRDPWRDVSGTTVGGFYFLDTAGLVTREAKRAAPFWAIVVSMSRVGQAELEPAPVTFNVCGSGIRLELQGGK